MQFGAGLAVIDEGFGLQRCAGRGAQPGRAGAHFEAGVRAVQRFALLAGKQLGEFLCVGLDGVGCFQECCGPGLVPKRCPCRLGGQGIVDGVLKVRDGVDGCFADGFACGGVEDGPGGDGVLGQDRCGVHEIPLIWVFSCLELAGRIVL